MRKRTKISKNYDYEKNHEFIKNPKSHDKLKKLNHKLIEIQKNLLDEVFKINKSALKRLHDKNDWVLDFETQISVYFYFDENHPDYEKYIKENNDDSLIATIKLDMSPNKTNEKNINDYYFFEPKINHNEFTFRKDHPMYGEFHCYLFHHLYDHLLFDEELDWETISKIGYIWTDIEIIYQHSYNLNKM